MNISVQKIEKTKLINNADLIEKIFTGEKYNLVIIDLLTYQNNKINFIDKYKIDFEILKDDKYSNIRINFNDKNHTTYINKCLRHGVSVFVDENIITFIDTKLDKDKFYDNSEYAIDLIII